MHAALLYSDTADQEILSWEIIWFYKIFHVFMDNISHENILPQNSSAKQPKQILQIENIQQRIFIIVIPTNHKLFIPPRSTVILQSYYVQGTPHLKGQLKFLVHLSPSTPWTSLMCLLSAVWFSRDGAGMLHWCHLAISRTSHWPCNWLVVKVEMNKQNQGGGLQITWCMHALVKVLVRLRQVRN